LPRSVSPYPAWRIVKHEAKFAGIVRRRSTPRCAFTFHSSFFIFLGALNRQDAENAQKMKNEEPAICNFAETATLQEKPSTLQTRYAP